MFDFQHNGNDYRYPSALSEITLGQRIAWQEQYGNELDERAQKVGELPEGIDRELAHLDVYTDTAVRSFSFFTGIPLAECGAIDLQQILNVYGTSAAVMAEEEENLPAGPHLFHGELWHIAPPEVTPDSGITFNEFLVSKEVVRQLYSLGNGFWTSLPYLCCVYLRKDDEPFAESLVKEEGERYQLMLELPLSIALAVAFFLASSMHSFNSISAYSSQAAGGKVPTWEPSLTDGGGSAS